MAYTIVSKFIDKSLYALKAPYAMQAQYITIHNTYNDATALGEIAYMSSNKNATSYHVAIDDKHAVQAVPFGRNAWHAGDGASGPGNRKSIGVEICYSKSGGPKYYAAEANAIEYIAHVLVQYGWGIDRVKWHRDWSGKNCPHRIFAEKREHLVRKKIADKVAEIKNPAPKKPAVTPVSAPKPKPAPPKPKPKEDVKVATKPADNKPSDWAKEAVELAVKLGITDGERLRDNGTREEMIVLIMRALDLAPRIK